MLPPTSSGFNTLLMGGSGSGKTHSAQTLLKAQRALDPEAQMLSVFTEPKWQPLSYLGCDDGFHIRYIPPGASTWDAMIKRSENLVKLPWDAAVKASDPNKNTFTAFPTLLHTFSSYTCDVCDTTFGDVTELPPTWSLWLDGMSGINHMALQMVVGGAVAKSQPQWGAAMDSELQVINALCYQTQCIFVLVTHLDKLIDEINGGMLIQPNCLGRKVAPELPKNFDDVILAERVGEQFKWNNAAANVDTRPSYLPIAANLPQDFGPIVRRWAENRADRSKPVPVSSQN